MDFEFDPAKSAANKAKHGIDFDEAQVLWNDSELAIAPALAGPEPRFLAIGKIHGKGLDRGLYMAPPSIAHHFCSAFARE
jgi:uncharacterized DUF497 family protein